MTIFEELGYIEVAIINITEQLQQLQNQKTLILNTIKHGESLHSNERVETDIIGKQNSNDNVDTSSRTDK